MILRLREIGSIIENLGNLGLKILGILYLCTVIFELKCITKDL